MSTAHDLALVTTTEMAEEICRRFDAARDNSAGVVAFTGYELGGNSFYRLSYGGSTVAAFGLSHAMIDAIRNKMSEDPEPEES